MQHSELIVEQVLEGYHFSVYRQRSPRGKELYVAKATLKDGETVLIDHWNLSVLNRRIRELIPVMQMARSVA